jgi:RNA polymerase sigma-70 factor (ECF subfamily)
MAEVGEPDLAPLFVRERPGATVPLDLELRLRSIAGRALAAWPGLPIDAGRLTSRIARAIGDDAEAGLAELHVEDFALAVACADELPGALALCDRLCAGAITAAVARVDRSPDLRDEVRQILWQRIFVGTAAQSPRIRSYGGRGPLAGWVAVAAQRIALDLRREEARASGQNSLADPLADQVLPADDHPEIDYLRTRYKTEFEAAVSAALAGLPDRDRLLLRLTTVSGLSHEQIGNIYGVNQSTVTRWISRAREQVLEATEREVCSRLRLPVAEFRSLAGMLVSRLDLSISRVLATSDSGP